MSALSASFNAMRVVAGAAAAVAAMLTAEHAGLFDPVPYRDAEVSRVVLHDDRHMLVTGSFVKTDETCIIDRVTIYAVLPRSLTPLAFEPVRPEGEALHRRPGDQVFTWDVFLNGWFPDEVEVWTRHDCQGEVVERMMVRFAVPPVTERG